MTIPNLYLTIRKISPLRWYACYKQRDLHTIEKLYYSTAPIPGIYAVTANGRQYLVAIKPIKGKKDTENIFEPAKKCYDNAILRSKAAKSNQVTSNINIRKLSFSSSRTTLNGGNNDKKDYSFTQPQHVKILRQDKPIHSKEHILFGTGGNAPHQKSPFRNCLITKHYNRHSPFLDFPGYCRESGLQEADINGFKKLRQPLRIEFCSITKRWMFSSEIKIRSEGTLMCQNSKCMRSSHEPCEKQTWRKMFALDDGYSWVEVGMFRKRKGNAMFRVDDETQCMRRQSKEEVKVSTWYLEREMGRFLECDVNTDYMSLVRYVQKKKVEVKKGELYLDKIERQSAQRAKLESGRLQEDGLEKQWVKQMTAMEERIRIKLVEAWNVKVREARVVEPEVGEVFEMDA